MKKNITLFTTLLLCLLSMNIIAQTLYRTYYDLEKTEVQEEFYADGYGTKNGLYKGFSEYGGIIIQGTFKDGKKEGEWTLNDDKGHLVSKETYLDDVLNGPASYYNFAVFGSVCIASGKFKDGEKVGVWNCIDKLIGSENAYYPHVPHADQMQYSDEWIKAVGSDIGIKYRAYYGETAPKNQLATFFPSDKKFLERISNAEGIYAMIFDYPNGTIYRLEVGDSIKTAFYREWYFPDGGIRDSISYYISKVRDVVFQQAVINELSKSNDGNSRKESKGIPKESTAIVNSDKAYYYKEADAATIRKAFNVKGDKLKYGQVSGDFIYVTYTSDKGTITQGWMLKSDLTIKQ